MKRILPLLLAILLLTACGAVPPAEPPQPETTEAPAETASAGTPEAEPLPDEDPEADELPRDDSEPVPAAAPPALSDTTVTLDGLNSYLRLTLPEGWTWGQAGGTADGVVYGLRPENDAAFTVELHYWPDGFGMCGTGVTTQGYTLPDGKRATLAYEIIGERIHWTLILPESPDSFTIQFSADMAVYETHRAELELMLSTLQQGVLAGLDVVVPRGSDA